MKLLFRREALPLESGILLKGEKMAKIPRNPEEIFPAITDDFKRIFGNDLIALILYGSGAAGDYIPGKSDINFLIILTESGMDHLGKVLETVARWRKRKVATPLFMTEDDMLSSLDSYPIEFLNIKANHVLVYGEDILSRISFKAYPLRLQCERELKGKIFHLRSGFLETEGQVKRIRELIKISLKAFISLFKALLFLKGIDILPDRREIIQAVAREYSVDPAIFLTCTDIKEGVDRIAASDMKAVFEAYLKEITKLSQVVDHLDI
jgi:hypothetical protein